MKYATTYHFLQTAIGLEFVWVVCPYCGIKIRIEKPQKDQAHLCFCRQVFIECLPKDRVVNFDNMG